MKQRNREEEKFCRRTMGSIAVLTLLAILLASCLLSAINDMYAFIKPDRAVTVEISDPQSVGELSRLLCDRGVLNNPSLFALYLRGKGIAETAEAFRGTLRLNAAMSYREILAELKNSETNE